jgi:hypothetical protein
MKPVAPGSTLIGIRQEHKSMRKRIAKIILLIVVSLAPVIIIPQIYDPLGLRYDDDIYKLIASFQCANADCTRSQLPEGTIHFKHGWSVTTEADGTRRAPDNAPDCRVQIALIGDSFTWGPNVNDDETWVNRLAQQFPEACFHNYAQWGYNAEQAALTLTEQVPAEMDYVLYFVFQNDNMGMYIPHKAGPPPSPFYAVRYAELIGWKFGLSVGGEGWAVDKPRYPERFAAAIQIMTADPRVHFFGFEDELLVHTVRDMGYDVFGIPLPPESERISPIDNHLNAAGHRDLAQHLAPLVQQLLGS